MKPSSIYGIFVCYLSLSTMLLSFIYAAVFALFHACIWRRQWHPTPVFLPGESQGRRTWWAAVHGVAKSRTRLNDFTFTFHFHALEKEMATHSGVLAWRIPGTGEPGGLPSMGSHRVGHNWSDLAAAAACLHSSPLYKYIQSFYPPTGWWTVEFFPSCSYYVKVII